MIQKQEVSVPIREKRGYRIPEAAKYLGCAPWYVELAVRSGRLAMDPAEVRIQQIMSEIALEPRQPRPAATTTAGLPTLAEWHRYLKTICWLE